MLFRSRLIQIREKNMQPEELAGFTREVVAMAHANDALVLLNGAPDIARDCGADGVHLDSAALMSCNTRPDVAWCGASCHNAVELERARALGLDFAVLGTLAATPSHPGAPTLGWQRFAELIRDYALPVFALGGVQPADMQTAWQCGAHGIAMIRGAWNL